MILIQIERNQSVHRNRDIGDIVQDQEVVQKNIKEVQNDVVQVAAVIKVAIHNTNIHVVPHLMIELVNQVMEVINVINTQKKKVEVIATEDLDLDHEINVLHIDDIDMNKINVPKAILLISILYTSQFIFNFIKTYLNHEFFLPR